MTRPLRQAAAAVIASLVLAACSEEAAQQPSPPPEVAVVTLSASSAALTRELPGRVSASQRAEVRPLVTGIVSERLFEEGSSVEVGQPLYQLEAGTIRADLDNARAAAERVRATRDAAIARLERARELAERGLISTQALEDAQAAAGEAEASVGVAASELRRRQLLLGYTRIEATLTGRIGRSDVTQGALVTANQEAPLATIQQLDPMHLDLAQSSSEWLELRKALDGGQLERGVDTEVDLMMEDGSRYPHPGRVAFAEALVDPGTGSLTLRVEVPNPDGMLLPGMYLRAAVPLGTRSAAIRVPQRAVQRDARGGAQVMLVDEAGTVVSRKIELGASLEGDWLVESGLATGERVVVSGLQKIRPGQAVRVVDEAAADSANEAPAPVPAGAPGDAG